MGSVRLRKRWCVSIATLTPCCQSLETHSFRDSTTPFVRLRRPIPTWTSQILKWRIKLKRLSCSLLQMTRTTSWLKLMVKVKGSQPQFRPSQTRPISPSLRLILRPSSRQPFNPSQSNRRTFQPKHSYLHVFIYFCNAFFVSGKQFFPLWIMCKQYCQCLINILLCNFICGIYLCGIFMYVYGGPSILWTCQIFNPHRVRPFCRLVQF